MECEVGLTAKPVADCRNALGDCCFQDPRDGCLWRTDIEGSRLWRMDPDHGTSSFVLPGRAGFILPRREPGFVLGFPNQLCLADAGPGTFTKLHDVVSERPDPEVRQQTIGAGSW